jgi:hypothetical protein
MSGGLGPYYVGGIKVDYISTDPLQDDVICSVFYQMAEFVNDDHIQDALLRASAQNGAKAGLQLVVQALAEHVAYYQAVGVSLSAQDGSIQVTWNNVLGTTQVQIERREADQSLSQLLALLDGSSTSFIDTTVSGSKNYVYDVKNLKNSDLVAVGYSKRVRAS